MEHDNQLLPPHGHLDYCQADKVYGWAWCKNYPHVQLKIEFRVDGRLLLTTTANRFRSDLFTLGMGTGNYGFEFVPPKKIFNNSIHRIDVTVSVSGRSYSLIGSPIKRIFERRELFFGEAKLTQSGVIEGWAADRGYGEKPPVFQVSTDTGECVYYSANILRQDIKKLYPRGSIFGFRGVIPSKWYQNSKKILVSGIVDGNPLALRGSPIKLEVRGSYYEQIINEGRGNLAEKKKIIHYLSRSHKSSPMISVLMPVYDPPEHYLIEAIKSVIRQSYRNWQLCIVDDASKNKNIRKILSNFSSKEKRIEITWRARNGNISAATNTALKSAKGSYIALLDHDDLLHTDALLHAANILARKSNVQMLFTDEDKCDTNGERYDPYRKSGWDRELILGQNCVSHLGIFRTSLVKRLGGFRRGYEGSQDYDLVLRAARELKDSQIHHLGKILYHWRASTGSTALANTEKAYASVAMQKALQDHLRTINLKAAIDPVANGTFFSIRPKLLHNKNLLSVILKISSRLNTNSLKETFNIFKDIPCEIIVLKKPSENLSTDDVNYCSFKRCKIVHYSTSEDGLGLFMKAALLASGNILCWIDTGMTPIDGKRGWLRGILGHALREDIGLVGPRFVNSQGSIQSAGLGLNSSKQTYPMFQGRSINNLETGALVALTRSVVAVDERMFFCASEKVTKVFGEGPDPGVYKSWTHEICDRLKKQGCRSIVYPSATFLCETE